MQSSEIKVLLHHREPYLMVSEVLNLDEKSIETKKDHRGDEAHLKGHFPGAPIVPGAMLQELCTQSAGILITKFYSPVEHYHSEVTKGHALGVLNKVVYAKFLGIVFPDKSIQAKVELIEKQNNLFKFKAKVFQAGEIKAKISFNLVNISDEYLFEKD